MQSDGIDGAAATRTVHQDSVVDSQLGAKPVVVDTHTLFSAILYSIDRIHY